MASESGHTMWKDEVAAVLSAAVAACRATTKVQMSLDIAKEVLSKQDKSPVTVADFAAQALIVRELLACFPSDKIVGEEDAKALRGKDQGDLRRRVVALATEFGNFGRGSKGLGGSRKPRNKDAPAAEGQKKEEEEEEEGVLWCIDQGAFDGVSYRADQKGASRRHWCVDPIDGTKGFLRKQQYAVCIGLVQEGQVVLGALGCPNLLFVPPKRATGPVEAGERDHGSEQLKGVGQKQGLVVVGARGRGSVAYSLQDLIRSGGKDDESVEKYQLTVSSCSDPSKGCFTESVESGHSNFELSEEVSKRLGVTMPPVRMDSQAKYACVARGQSDMYLRLSDCRKECVWDHAAGVAVVENAGGKVTDALGKPLDFRHGRQLLQNSGVIATNGSVHDRVTSITAELWGKQKVKPEKPAVSHI